MNTFDLIELKKPSFTKTDMQVCDALMDNHEVIFRKSSSQLAKDLHLSQASIIRFCKKLGYDGYNDFRFALYDSIHSSSEPDGFTSKAECYKKLIDLISNEAQEGKYDKFAKKLASANMIYCTGVHRSSLPAQLLSMELSLLGKRAVFLGSEILIGWPKDISSDDVFVCFSEQGDPSRKYYDFLFPVPGEEMPDSYLITMYAKHPLRKQFANVILLPGSTNQNMPERVEPSCVFSIFTDIVTNIIVNEMKENEADEDH